MSLPPNRNILKDYPNRYFLETGNYRGDGLQLAIEAGFQRIIGIELFQEWIDFCKNRFNIAAHPNLIKLIHGDSALCLWEVIKHIPEPITFFLDSHSQLFEDEPEMENPFPLLKELEQIAAHPVKTSTIIIDDYLYLTHGKVTGWVNGEIEKALLKINPDYKIEYVANPVKQNLLIATV